MINLFFYNNTTNMGKNRNKSEDSIASSKNFINVADGVGGSAA